MLFLFFPHCLGSAASYSYVLKDDGMGCSCVLCGDGAN